jgi:hypothetical protein
MMIFNMSTSYFHKQIHFIIWRIILRKVGMLKNNNNNNNCLFVCLFVGPGTITLHPTFGSFILLELVSHQVNWFLWWKCLDCLDWNGFWLFPMCSHQAMFPSNQVLNVFPMCPHQVMFPSNPVLNVFPNMFPMAPYFIILYPLP